METILNIAEGPLPEGVTQEIHDAAIAVAPKLTTIFATQEQTIQWYVEVDPAVYDEVMRLCNFNEPYYIVDEVARLVRESGNPKPQMLDVGAGTGLIGLKLHEKPEGRKVEIIGVDASE